MEAKTRLYVLDTSVLIHDPEALRSYRQTAIAIPIFVVMELDDLKTSPRHEVASAARTVSRRIITLADHGSLHDPEGVKDPETESTVYIIGNEAGAIDTLKNAVGSRKIDSLILESAVNLKARFPDHEVVLVSKDVNQRILAGSLGLVAIDYDQDRVVGNDIPTGYHEVPEEEWDTIAAKVSKDAEPCMYSLSNGETLIPNEFIVGGSGILRYKNGVFVHVHKTYKSVGITPRNIEQRMALDLLMDQSVQLVTLLGMAGTGKSFLALAACIAQLDGAYDRIILSKPVVAMGRDIGFLPGSQDEKLAPWMLSFYDNLDQIFSPGTGETAGRKGVKEKSYEQLLHSKKVEIQPIHSIRGRSIAKAIMLVDEAQNMTPHEVKTVVSRAAAGTKVILCGDPHQIDDAYLDAYTNGLVHASVAARGTTIAGTVTLTQGVRSPLSELAATKL